MAEIEDDIRFMRIALREAAKGVGLTSPNPPVGCVIVRDGVVIGKGWHTKAGRPHAEREAIASVRNKLGDKVATRQLRGATLYVTLEPCSTHGRTPACTEAIVEAGIGRVVFGICRSKSCSRRPCIRHSLRAWYPRYEWNAQG